MYLFPLFISSYMSHLLQHISHFANAQNKELENKSQCFLFCFFFTSKTTFDHCVEFCISLNVTVTVENKNTKRCTTHQQLVVYLEVTAVVSVTP